jgi:hypothetical protein
MVNLLVGGVALLSVVVQGNQQTEHAKRALYGKLFTLAQPVIVQRGGAERATLPQRGACNMPMIAGNTEVDPKIVKPIDKGKTDPKIRAIEPPVCWEGGRR